MFLELTRSATTPAACGRVVNPHLDGIDLDSIATTWLADKADAEVAVLELGDTPTPTPKV